MTKKIESNLKFKKLKKMKCKLVKNCGFFFLIISIVTCTQPKKDNTNESWIKTEEKFKIFPDDIPNTGILFVNHKENNRSGHGGHVITECKNGDILAFYMNTWAEDWNGHSCAGWSSYKRSTDGGKTWSEPIDFEYSKEVWNSSELFSALVFSLITAPDGTLIATLVHFENSKWQKQIPPVYLLSHDHGKTWSEPFKFDESATLYDIAMTFNTSFIHENEIFIVFMGDARNMCPGGYTLYVSDDNGKSFKKRSTLPFDERDYYSAASVLDNGEIIVYSYPYRGRDTDEKNLPFVISKDNGYTWSEINTAYFAKALRNPQMSEKIGDYYFVHGRSGSYGDNPGNFVLYSSKDGINWDDGVYLMSRQKTPGGGDCYSGNTVIGKYDSLTPERLLIQADISYNGPRVNINHWWIELN